jgi:predicted nucleic acid-binding protein
MSYWDTACLIKIYVDETDSSIFRRFLQERDEAATTGDFARLEFLTTLWRLEADGTIAEGFAEKTIRVFDRKVEDHSFRLLACDVRVREEFERIVRRCYSHDPPVLVRTLDALHVAGAIVSGETEIVATDRRLRDAAALFGFQLFPIPTP